MNPEEYDGADVHGPDGDKIGTVQRTYVTDQGVPRYVEVKIGSLLAKHRLVPVDALSPADNGFQVPFSGDVVENSPDAGAADDTVRGPLLEKVRAYYDTRGSAGFNNDAAETSSDTEPTADATTAQDIPVVAAADPSSMEIRNLGDVIEIPVVEERLVKQPVVTEVVRVRKSQLAENQTVRGTVRREDIEIEREGDAAQ